ncbi:MAG: hypothetical protein ACM3Q2_04750 [Syntrophothermus sp.]
MSENEQKQLDMYEAVLLLLSENKDIISQMPTFNWAISKLKKVIDEIKREDKVISHETFEITIKTSNIKDNLIFGLVPVTSAVFQYARSVNNLSLKEKTRFTQSHFVRMLDKELIERAEVILAIAYKNLEHLSMYGISKKTLEDLSTRIQDFKNILDNKLASLISTSTLTPLTDLFNEADKILSKYMDVYAENLIEEYEEFYDDYLWTRNVENLDDKKALMELEEED